MCTVCEHSHRAEIEQDLLNISATCTIEDISDKWDIATVELQRHAIEHTTVAADSETEVTSIARQMKYREASMLLEVAEEYLHTLKNVGERINSNLANAKAEATSASFERMLTKPMADMYIGLGSEIRQTVRAIADVRQILEGPRNDSVSGLEALAKAINASRG